MEHSTSAVNWQPRNLAKLPGPAAPQQPRARRPRRRRRAVLPVAAPRGPAPRSSTPRWCRTPAPTPRCSREVCELGADLAGPRRGARQPGRRRRRDPVRLGGLVGASSWTRTPASTSPTPTGCTRAARRALAGRRHRRRRPPVGRPQRLPAGRRADPLPGPRRRRRRAAPATSRAAAPRLVTLLLRHRRRATTTSGSAATRARSATCSASASRSSSRCARASRSQLDDGTHRRRVDRVAAPRRRRGARVVRRRAAAGRAGADPARGRRRRRLVRRHPAGRRRPPTGWSARLLAEAGVRPAVVGAVRRGGGPPPRRRPDLAVRRSTTPTAEVRLPAHGIELLTGARCAGELTVPAGEVAVVREDRT